MSPRFLIFDYFLYITRIYTHYMTRILGYQPTTSLYQG
jgi:hypothetical protein